MMTLKAPELNKYTWVRKVNNITDAESEVNTSLPLASSGNRSRIQDYPRISIKPDPTLIEQIKTNLNEKASSRLSRLNSRNQVLVSTLDKTTPQNIHGKLLGHSVRDTFLTKRNSKQGRENSLSPHEQVLASVETQPIMPSLVRKNQELLPPRGSVDKISRRYNKAENVLNIHDYADQR